MTMTTPDLDPDAAARSAIYSLLARALDTPTAALHERLEDGSFAAELESLLDRTGLDVPVDGLVTEDDADTLQARYNDLFVTGFAADGDPTPPVSLYESSYRDDATWHDVNVDLSRAYDYFGLEIDEDHREHHDHVRLELEFASYLARREAAVGPDAGRARRDFIDRHLDVLASGMAGRIDDEPGVDVYGSLVAFLGAFVAADGEDG